MMKISRFNKLSFRLPAFVAIVILAVSASLSVITFMGSRDAAIKQAEVSLEILATGRAESLKERFEAVEANLRTIATSPATLQSVTEYATIWRHLDPIGRARLREAYGPDGKVPAIAEDAYGMQFQRSHSYYRNLSEINGFHDIALIDPDGNVLYSVTMEEGFENAATGSLAGSGMGEVVNLALRTPGDGAHISRFTTYGPSGGKVLAFAASRINRPNGDLAGILVAEVDVTSLAGLLADAATGNIPLNKFLVDPDGKILVNGSKVPVDEGRQSSLPEHVALALRGETASLSDVPGLSAVHVTAFSMPVQIGQTTYAVVAEEPSSAVLAYVSKLRNEAALLAVIAAGITSILAWLVIRTITFSLDRLGNQMTQIANGDYTVDVTESRRNDEIGDIGRRLVDFRTKLEIAAEQEETRKQGQARQQIVIDELGRGLARLAQGDMSRPINSAFDPQYEGLREAFNETLRILSEAISEVKNAAGSISHGAVEISQASDDLSNRTENQAATLEETAAALDELTASVKSAADGARSVETIVLEAQAEAEQSGKIVGDAIAAMTEIEKSSEHISQIIGVIDDIAFQTNLLALNAGVEAARAGEAGKGFAVVASEVRALAQRSSEAAKEIKALISGSAKQVEHGVDLVGGAGKALANIVQRVTHISDLIRGIAKGSSEQAIGLGEINIGVNQLDQVTQQNAAMVEEATAASHVLKRDAERLQDLVSRFATIDAPAAEVVEFASARQGGGQAVVQFQKTQNPRFTPAPKPMAMAIGGTGRAGGSTSTEKEWIDF
mgnify:FL=1